MGPFLLLVPGSSEPLSTVASDSIPHSPTSGPSFLISAVHAPCDIYLRRTFWSTLAASSPFSTPWGIGDFNAILNLEERWRLALFHPTSFSDFLNFLTLTGLVDICFKGNPFTWANNSQGRKCVSAKLDRMAVNQDWLNAFRDPILEHLPRQSPDK